MASLSVPVLLIGDYGPVRRRVARIIHERSARAHGPFVTLHCAEPSWHATRSTIFGRMPGCHSCRPCPGAIAQADYGTLFLDAIEVVEPWDQADLLPLIHSGEYRPRGALRPRRADVRLIVGTAYDLGREVERGRFREDLFRQLVATTVTLPPLADCTDAIPWFGRLFFADICAQRGFTAVSLSADTMTMLRIEWLHGVRPLRSAMERAVLASISEGISEVLPRHFLPVPEALGPRVKPANPTGVGRSWPTAPPPNDGCVGQGLAFRALSREIARAAPSNEAVLLAGSSTGLSHVARMIHDRGPRAKGRFVELNCSLTRGVHSAVVAQKVLSRAIAEAEGGTLYLDTVEELSPPAQAHLLWLLDHGTYWPTGASDARRASVRVVAGTSADLSQAVEDLRFRADFLARLVPGMIPVHLQPASEYDLLPWFAELCFVDACCRHGLPELTLSIEAIRLLQTAWRRDIRKLDGAMECAVLMAASERSFAVAPDHIPA